MARGSGAAAAFAALGDPVRLRLVARLSQGGPQCIAQLTAGAGVTRQALTKHLRALERAGLAQSRRRGRERVWRLRRERLRETERYLEQIAGQWERTLLRLRDYLGEGGGAAAAPPSQVGGRR